LSLRLRLHSGLRQRRSVCDAAVVGRVSRPCFSGSELGCGGSVGSGIAHLCAKVKRMNGVSGELKGAQSGPIAHLRRPREECGVWKKRSFRESPYLKRSRRGRNLLLSPPQMSRTVRINGQRRRQNAPTPNGPNGRRAAVRTAIMFIINNPLSLMILLTARNRE
jgi:hypothetical protein